MLAINIREPVLEDVAAILEIEKCYSSPWSSAAILEEINRENGLQFVAVHKDDGKIVGWCCALITLNEVELLKIGVDKKFIRQQVATALLDHLQRECFRLAALRIFLEVRMSNKPARSFYEKNGFHPLHKRKNYYNKPKEDAVIYEKVL